MIEQKVRIISEGLARSVNRRDFLRKTGTAIFTGMAALAAGHLATDRSAAKAIEGGPQCAPPGPYCNTGGGILSGCHGSSCYQHMQQGEIAQCRVFYIYQAGCWTTYVGGGYWVCCDCECFFSFGRRSCGCAQFSTKPDPRPDGPSG